MTGDPSPNDPIPFAQPAIPIGYAYPVTGRPGLITAIGTISIILGSLGLLVNGFGSLSGFGFLLASSAITTKTMTVTAPPPMTVTSVWNSAAGSTGNSVEAATVDGLSADTRKRVITQMREMASLSDEQVTKVDTFLTERGTELSPILKSEPSDQAVAAVFSEVTVRNDDTVFTTGFGRLHVDASNVTFVRTDGDTVSASNLPKVKWNGGYLTLDEFIAALNTQAGGKMSAAMTKTLKTMLEAPQQTLVPSGTVPTSVFAFVDGSGNGTFTFPGAFVTISGNGTTTSVNNFGTTAVNPFAGMNKAVLVVSMVLAILSLLISIYLLVIGILTLRGSMRGRSLHYVYVWLKIPMSVIGLLASYVMWSQFFSSVPSATPGVVSGMVVMMGVVSFAFAVAYPVGLLFALRAKSVREYYQPISL